MWARLLAVEPEPDDSNTPRSAQVGGCCCVPSTVMSDDSPPDLGQDMAAQVAACASCRRLHPDGQRCACLLDRAFVLAEILHEVTRASTPRWRAPRAWDDLSERARQDRVLVVRDVIEVVEDAGWRMVTTYGDGAHLAADEAKTPPTGIYRLPDVVG